MYISKRYAWNYLCISYNYIIGRCRCNTKLAFNILSRANRTFHHNISLFASLVQYNFHLKKLSLLPGFSCLEKTKTVLEFLLNFEQIILTYFQIFISVWITQNELFYEYLSYRSKIHCQQKTKKKWKIR